MPELCRADLCAEVGLALAAAALRSTGGERRAHGPAPRYRHEACV